MQQSITSLRAELRQEQDEAVEKAAKKPAFLLKLPSGEKETRNSIALMKWCKTRFSQRHSALMRPQQVRWLGHPRVLQLQPCWQL